MTFLASITDLWKLRIWNSLKHLKQAYPDKNDPEKVLKDFLTLFIEDKTPLSEDELAQRWKLRSFLLDFMYIGAMKDKGDVRASSLE